MIAGPTGARVGWGFDAHALNGPPPLVLAGVQVSDTLGADATSDGDVVAHAVTDALLGACVLGDMGEHFPSDDPEMSGADSMALLTRAVAMASDAGWQATHLDVTVLAQSVRIAPHRLAMATRLAASLRIPAESVSVKASTTDGLGAIGRGDGIAVVAVVTVGAPA